MKRRCALFLVHMTAMPCLFTLLGSAAGSIQPAEQGGHEPIGSEAYLDMLFPWSQDPVRIAYPTGSETFIYASASWPWHRHPVESGILFLYYEEELYQDLASVINAFRQTNRRIYVVLDPEPPGGENNTFLDLYYNQETRSQLIGYLAMVIRNLTSLGVNGYVVGDEWPRGLNREPATLARLVRYNQTYHKETGVWMNTQPDLEQKVSLAEWFYQHSIQAWNNISNTLRQSFPETLMGTNIDLVWQPDYSGIDLSLWKPALSWSELDLQPYDFIVTHYYTKMLGQDSGNVSTPSPVQVDSQSTASLQRALGMLFDPGCNLTRGKKVFLMLAAHCNYPHVITPMQMVSEWNMASRYPLAGLGWFTFDVWISGGKDTNWTDCYPITDTSVQIPMKIDRLLTLKGLAEAHNYMSRLEEEDIRREAKRQDLTLSLLQDEQQLEAADFEKKKREPTSLNISEESENRLVAYMLTQDASLQEWPDVSGRMVVWEDARNGNRDVYLYDLDSLAEKRITLVGDQRWPTIDGPYVAYWDLRLANATNFRIVYENISMMGRQRQRMKVLSLNGTLLYEELYEGDRLKEGGWIWKVNATPSFDRFDIAGLCLYDLSSGTVRLLDLAWTNPDGFSRDPGFCSPGRIFVDSSSGWVGYQQPGSGDMVFCSVDGRREVRITRYKFSTRLLGICGGRAVWFEEKLESGIASRICIDSLPAGLAATRYLPLGRDVTGMDLACFRDLVVWYIADEGSFHVCNLSSNTTSSFVAGGPEDTGYIEVSNSLVVWVPRGYPGLFWVEHRNAEPAPADGTDEGQTLVQDLLFDGRFRCLTPRTDGGAVVWLVASGDDQSAWSVLWYKYYGDIALLTVRERQFRVLVFLSAAQVLLWRKAPRKKSPLNRRACPCLSDEVCEKV